MNTEQKEEIKKLNNQNRLAHKKESREQKGSDFFEDWDKAIKGMKLNSREQIKKDVIMQGMVQWSKVRDFLEKNFKRKHLPKEVDYAIRMFFPCFWSALDQFVLKKQDEREEWARRDERKKIWEEIKESHKHVSIQITGTEKNKEEGFYELLTHCPLQGFEKDIFIVPSFAVQLLKDKGIKFKILKGAGGKK